MAGEGKDPETRTPQTENTNTENKDEGDRRRGRGGSQQTTNNKQQTRSQNLFAADFLTIVVNSKKVFAITDICIKISTTSKTLAWSDLHYVQDTLAG